MRRVGEMSGGMNHAREQVMLATAKRRRAARAFEKADLALTAALKTAAEEGVSVTELGLRTGLARPTIYDRLRA